MLYISEFYYILWNLYNMHLYTDDRWIGYENGSSLWYKMEHIKSKGYGGVMNWALDLDDFRGICGNKNALLKVLWISKTTY